MTRTGRGCRAAPRLALRRRTGPPAKRCGRPFEAGKGRGTKSPWELPEQIRPVAPLSQRGQSLPHHFMLSLWNVPPFHHPVPLAPPLPAPRVPEFRGPLGSHGSQPQGLGVKDRANRVRLKWCGSHHLGLRLVAFFLNDVVCLRGCRPWPRQAVQGSRTPAPSL